MQSELVLRRLIGSVTWFGSLADLVDHSTSSSYSIPQYESENRVSAYERLRNDPDPFSYP